MVFFGLSCEAETRAQVAGATVANLDEQDIRSMSEELRAELRLFFAASDLDPVMRAALGMPEPAHSTTPTDLPPPTARSARDAPPSAVRVPLDAARWSAADALAAREVTMAWLRAVGFNVTAVDRAYAMPDATEDPMAEARAASSAEREARLVAEDQRDAEATQRRYLKTEVERLGTIQRGLARDLRTADERCDRLEVDLAHARWREDAARRDADTASRHLAVVHTLLGGSDGQRTLDVAERLRDAIDDWARRSSAMRAQMKPAA